MNVPDKKPFFVGYLDMPKQLKRFYIPLVILLGAFSAFVGYTIASQQKSTGPATWQTDSAETITGLLIAEPYPVLHRFDPENSQKIDSILLVSQGKHSAESFTDGFKNEMVTVTGYLVRRGGWTMLELVSEEPVKLVQEVTGADLVSRLAGGAVSKPLGPVTLSGEVADTKCFLGVMKPGAGSVHKACAEVCLLGGIPGMLLVRTEDGNKYGYILTQPDGSSASKMLSKRAADSVEITGELQQKGNLLYIKMAADGLRG